MIPARGKLTRRSLTKQKLRRQVAAAEAAAAAAEARAGQSVLRSPCTLLLLFASLISIATASGSVLGIEAFISRGSGGHGAWKRVVGWHTPPQAPLRCPVGMNMPACHHPGREPEHAIPALT